MLGGIKSIYFLEKIFKNHLEEKKYLNILFHNKNLQSKIGISIYDYKEYFNKIEIEIIPTKTLEEDKNYFINRVDNKKDYYHIYFDNNTKEIKRRYITSDDKISKIKIIIDEEIDSLKELFFGSNCIKEINFIKFNRKNITNMISMFEECIYLDKLNISKIKTDNVNNIRAMFRGCKSLKEIDLSSFNTEKVEKMHNLFYDCWKLEKINISNFDTSKVKNMSYMFYDCKSLKNLNINNFNTDNVEDMSAMFYGCHSLKYLNISNFNFSKVIKMSFMFYDCFSLNNLDIPNLIINEKADIDSMFSNCKQELKDAIIKINPHLRKEAFRNYI
jgi:surface protein